MTDIPVSDSALLSTGNRPPVQHALYDGEEYELLFTVPRDKSGAFETSWRTKFELGVSRIGVMTDNVGVIHCVTPDGIEVEPLNDGYDHFRMGH